MNRMTGAIVAGLALGAVVGAIVLSPEEANADRSLGTASAAGAKITRGRFHRLPDAGWFVEACGETTKVEDGGRISLDVPCVQCEPGAFRDAPAACLAAFKTANGL